MNKRSLSRLITKTEHVTMKWLRPLPHLPRNARSWLAENIWWIITIAMFLTAIATFVALINIFAYMSYMGNAPSYSGIYNTPLYSGLWLVDTLILFAFLALVTYLYYKAVNPLKAKHAAGWRLLFIVLLVGGVRVLIAAFMSLNPFVTIYALLASVVGLAIGAYLLFEIRSYFVKEAK